MGNSKYFSYSRVKVCSNAKTPELAESNLREGAKRSGLIGEFLSGLGDRNCMSKDEGSDSPRAGFSGTKGGGGIGAGIGAGIGVGIGAGIGAGVDGGLGVIREI